MRGNNVRSDRGRDVRACGQRNFPRIRGSGEHGIGLAGAEELKLALRHQDLGQDHGSLRARRGSIRKELARERATRAQDLPAEIGRDGLHGSEDRAVRTDIREERPLR